MNLFNSAMLYFIYMYFAGIFSLFSSLCYINAFSLKYKRTGKCNLFLKFTHHLFGVRQSVSDNWAHQNGAEPTKMELLIGFLKKNFMRPLRLIDRLESVLKAVASAGFYCTMKCKIQWHVCKEMFHFLMQNSMFINFICFIQLRCAGYKTCQLFLFSLYAWKSTFQWKSYWQCVIHIYPASMIALWKNWEPI